MLTECIQCPTQFLLLCRR